MILTIIEWEDAQILLEAGVMVIVKIPMLLVTFAMEGINAT